MTKEKTNSRGRPRNNEENTLLLYLQEINCIPLLKKEEETRLAKLAAKGNAVARERLISANLRFVVSIAKKYQGKGLPLEDLISEGNLGLLNAVKYFDVEKGYRFITYAVWWVRQAILKAIFEKARLIRLPGNKLIELNKVEKARQIISMKPGLSSEEEVQAIATFLDISVKKTMELMSIHTDVQSIDEAVLRGNSSVTVKDFVLDDFTPGPAENAINSVLKDELEKEVGKLEERSAELISCRYGLNGKTPLTLKEAGVRYNLSRERVRQIEKKALGQLKQSKKVKKLKNYIA